MMKKTYRQPATEIVTVEIQTLLTSASGDDKPNGADLYDEGFSSSSAALSRGSSNSLWDDEEE